MSDSNIIEVNKDGAVGDATVEIDGNGRNSSSISLQQYQDIYNQITGRTEEISISSKKSTIATLQDIVQLDLKIHQLLEQFRVVSVNSSFTIFYDNGAKEAFSSIERFRMLNASTNDCTESILINYNIAIVLPSTSRPQNYTVAVRLINQIIVQEKLSRDLPAGVPRGLVNSLAAKTFDVKITYVDYVVAKTISTTVTDWINSLDETKESSVLSFMKSKSHYFPPIFKNATLALSSIILITLMPSLVGESPSISELGSLFLMIFLFLFFMYKTAGLLGKFAENSVDSTCESSYLKITRGDEKYVTKECSNNKTAIRKAIAASTVTFVLNFVAKYLALHLKI